MYLGMDLGASNIRSAVVDLGPDPPRLLGRDERPNPVRPDWQADPDRVVAEVVASARAALASAGLTPADLAGAGCAAAAWVDRTASHLYGEPPVRLAERLSAGLDGVRTVVDRDTNAAAVAEGTAGAARGVADFVYLTVSTGIGCTIVANGRMVRGAAGVSGEIGHWPVAPDGPRCPCGMTGCLDMLASGRAIAELYAGTGTLPATDTRAVFDAVPVDARAAETVATAGAVLADAAVGLVNLLGPELIVVGGALADHWPEHVVQPVRAAVGGLALGPAAAAVTVEPARFGADVGIVGAAIEARERLGGRTTWFV
ncbi:MAG TPA: ROK family protein [Micromonosporaceae bacterium]|nr:ROK family protein [Micromonosporaceae bacterium]